MTGDAALGRTSRRLRDLVEPIAAGVYFAPEATAGYEVLGLDWFEGYFCSRSACLGKAPWTVVCGAFGVFEPSVVEQFVTSGWAKTDPEPVLAARLAGAEASLERLAGSPTGEVARATEILRSLTDGLDVAGRALFAGLAALSKPTSPWGALWRAADLVRERRGDAHVAAWIPYFDACEINLVTELAWGLPPRSFVLTRGWKDDALDAAYARLESRGLVESESLTGAGRRLRGDVERATDQAERAVIERLADDADELFALLEPWSKAIIGGKGYPIDPSALPDVRG